MPRVALMYEHVAHVCVDNNVDVKWTTASICLINFLIPELDRVTPLHIAFNIDEGNFGLDLSFYNIGGMIKISSVNSILFRHSHQNERSDSCNES
ncbi:hypothetical protein AVEN_185044-1 [Araneus ventricosus]|uniref:Uncharacterized protein n=1 Tax=Araneus ventricosus TaxID=182803 RepID=A0A4Y2BRL9_ARAVE|nr:hypothetical protein AVEN_185044-1 [Araneus ventricosus]